MQHELKIWPEYFDDVESGRKTFEVRKLDRLFGVGDTLLLREWSLIKGYSGRETVKEITYVMAGGQWGLSEGNCILGIKPAPQATVSGKEVGINCSHDWAWQPTVAQFVCSRCYVQKWPHELNHPSPATVSNEENVKKDIGCFRCGFAITPEDDGMCINEGTEHEMYQCDDCHEMEFGVRITPSLLVFNNHVSNGDAASQSYPRWVKASERLPEKKTDDLSKDKGIIFANIKRTAIMYVFLSITPNIPAMLQNDLNGWQWLEETPSSIQEQK